MKILVISNMYPSSQDKVYGTFVKTFFDGLKDSGYEATLVAIKGKCSNNLTKLLKYVKFYTSVFFLLLVKKYDIVYVHTISHTSPPVLLASKIRKFNTVFNIHGDDLLTTSKLALRLRNLCIPLLKESQMIVVPTLYFRDILMSEFNWIEKDKVVVSPSGGLNERFFVSKSREANTIPVFGYVSRIDPGKGWEILIDAAKIVIGKGYKIKLMMVGAGKQELDLRNKINELQLQNVVNYIGALTHEQLPSFYSSLDWFVFPSYREGESLGLVGLEAMAAHTPVIGSNMAGLKSYIIDDENGYYFKPNNLTDLADKIIMAIKTPIEKKERMSDSAFETAQAYESNKVNKELFDKIEKIAEKGSLKK